MNHLLDGAIEALKRGPGYAPGVTNQDFTKAYKDKMIQVIAHYENGGTMLNRP